LKSDVITEQFSRIAKMELQVEVEEVAGPLGWRTRCSAVTTKAGALGFYQARSHKIIPVDDCRILVPEMRYSELAQRGAKGDQRIEISISNTGERTIVYSKFTRRVSTSSERWARCRSLHSRRKLF